MTAFLDLFSGIGGFALAAYNAGLRFDAHYFSEVDPYAISVYQRRFPDATALGDIRAVSADLLPVGDWILAGGFPCVDISVAGKGAGLDGEQSGLWREYARLIGELRPRYAIVENVAALTGRGLGRILGAFSEIGYDAEWSVIRASDVGAPHKRERIWIVAYPYGNGIRDEPGRIGGTNGAGEGEPRDDGEKGIMAHASRILERRQIEWAERERIRKGCQSFTLADSSRNGRITWRQSDAEEGSERRQSDRGSEFSDFPYADRQPSRRVTESWRQRDWWLTEPDVGRVAHGVPARVDRLRCLGNAVVPDIPEMIFAQPAFDEWRTG